MASFTYQRQVAAPPETVFEVLTDHRRYTEITPLRKAELEREGEPAPNGVGAIRRLSAVGPPMREEVLAYEPSTRFSYKLLSGLPVRDHVGTVELTPSGGRDQGRLRGPHHPDPAAGRRPPSSPRSSSGSSSCWAASPKSPSGAPREWLRAGLEARRLATSLLRERRASTAPQPLGWRSPCSRPRSSSAPRARRLRAAEAPGRRPQPRRDLHAAEAEGAAEGGEDGQLADVRAQPGPHPLPAGEGDQAPIPQTLALHRAGRCSSSRRSTSAASSTSSTTTASPTRSTPTPARTLWERRIGDLNASSPTYYRHRLYIVNLVPGHIVKLDAKTGKTIWKKIAAGPGRVLAGGRRPHRLLRLRGRRPLRAQHDQRRRALGDPAGRPGQGGAGLLRRPPLRRRLRRLHERGRRQERQAGLAERLARARASAPPGQFYSTPAVAYGRVYSGNNDGRVYSFDISDGTLAWSYSTGGYAYSGPTVANTRHSPPTVFIGSFDGNVYALDAKDGSVRWSRSAGGQVIGSLSAVGDIVYVAEFTDKTHHRLHDAQRQARLPLPARAPTRR